MAQNDLGVLYAKGQGVPQNDVKAAKWYEKAAAQGLIRALSNLGLAYVMGQGVPQNDAMALKLFSLAAESGDGGARSNLGNMYAFGKGVEQDYVQALMWFNLAAYAFEASNERDMTAQGRIRVSSIRIATQTPQHQCGTATSGNSGCCYNGASGGTRTCEMSSRPHLLPSLSHLPRR